MNLDNLRNFGVELEFAGNCDMHEMARKIHSVTGTTIHVRGYSDKSNLWRLKSDASVSGRGGYGMELVTPILKGEADMQTLIAVVKVCEANGTVNRTCGMHVHVDITNAADMPLRKLMKFFAKYENAIGGLLSESRRGGNNRYCADHFNGTENLWDYFTKLNSTSKNDLLSRSRFSTRGKWNFQNYWRQGTVENRAHQGTISPEKVENWVRLTQGFVETAFAFRGTTVHREDDTRTYTTKNMLDEMRKKNVITLAVKKFYMRRFKELNNAVCR
jgi:hypothetical protein